MNQVVVGDARHIPLPDESVSLICTSPPYWSLRRYSDQGDDQLGLEPTPDLYVAHMVEVFREVWRVLRDDGVAVMNLGDSYAASASGTPVYKGWSTGGVKDASANRMRESKEHGLKPKSKCLIPHRVAIALQEDGWILRQDVPALKRAAMPESVRDRPTTAHEYIFMLVKSSRSYWDADAIRKPNKTMVGPMRNKALEPYNEAVSGGKWVPGERTFYSNGGRNFRTTDLILDEDGEPLVYVWHPQNFTGSHFATFPVGLAEPWVRAGCPERTCPTCGTGWVRVVTETGKALTEWQRACGGDDNGGYDGQAVKAYEGTGAENASDVKRRILAGMVEKTHIWQPGCDCYDVPLWVTAKTHEDDETGELVVDDPGVEGLSDYSHLPNVPGLVLDPFCGSGTVGIAAARWNRQFLGIDRSPTYAKMANERIAKEGFRVETKTDKVGMKVTQLSIFEESWR